MALQKCGINKNYNHIFEAQYTTQITYSARRENIFDFRDQPDVFLASLMHQDELCRHRMMALHNILMLSLGIKSGQLPLHWLHHLKAQIALAQQNQVLVPAPVCPNVAAPVRSLSPYNHIP